MCCSLAACAAWMSTSTIYWDTLPFSCLKHISVSYCGELKKLPLNLNSAKGNLLTIEGREYWWQE
ncbi:hypothetical protein Gotri_026574 [Gossypium trilobum]|uniref:Uncharacterized protein n=1 Tax=Gossypium trilobum TaxID=34281 RepID=A0A7J9FI33_9ROSI|nr:hypothetical protein [Gossypium trilobum]